MSDVEGNLNHEMASSRAGAGRLLTPDEAGAGAEAEGTTQLPPFGVDELAARARGYYTAVDSGDVDAVLACFSEDAVYRRPGYEPIVGSAGLREFYGGVRVISSGAHELDEVVVQGMSAATRGVFTGRLRDGSDTRVGFADFFGFDDAGRIRTRSTFFDAPAV
ncbi:nuclear transport factor 2 family protein [Agilicoccus flavus]|uniref:nuclear transport factor 2 family protein n=1 Tax=Agilicoccus flavus TaxID=2775968 RepID=UPI0027D9E261|nr:nuclear transport factor 2 family protein [Agilicoccus flavus]